MDDSIIATIVILLLTALGNWLQKKKEGSTEDESPPPLPPNRRTPPPASPASAPRIPSHNWQDDLRRVLQGEPVLVPKSSGPARPVPPPRPAASPPPPVPRPPHGPVAHAEPLAKDLPALSHSEFGNASAAYERARQLHEHTAHHLKAVSDPAQWGAHDTQQVGGSRPSKELSRVLALLRQPRGMRQAVIAATIIGPPKGLGWSAESHSQS